MNESVETAYGEELLALAEHLFEKKDAEGLWLLQSVTVGPILSHVLDIRYSIIEINEYINALAHDIKDNNCIKSKGTIALHELITTDTTAA